MAVAVVELGIEMATEVPKALDVPGALRVVPPDQFPPVRVYAVTWPSPDAPPLGSPTMAIVVDPSVATATEVPKKRESVGGERTVPADQVPPLIVYAVTWPVAVAPPPGSPTMAVAAVPLDQMATEVPKELEAAGGTRPATWIHGSTTTGYRAPRSSKAIRMLRPEVSRLAGRWRPLASVTVRPE